MNNKEIFELFDDELLNTVLQTIYQSLERKCSNFTFLKVAFERRILAILAGKYRVPLWFDNINEVLGCHNCLDIEEYRSLCKLVDFLHYVDELGASKIVREELVDFVNSLVW